MALKYLIDENVNPIYPNQIRLREPDIIIKVVGEPKTPPLKHTRSRNSLLV